MSDMVTACPNYFSLSFDFLLLLWLLHIALAAEVLL